MLQQTIQQLTDQFVTDFFAALRTAAISDVSDIAQARPNKTKPVSAVEPMRCARCRRPLLGKEQKHTRCPKCLKKHAGEQRVRDTKRRRAERAAKTKAPAPAPSQVRLAS